MTNRVRKTISDNWDTHGRTLPAQAKNTKNDQSLTTLLLLLQLGHPSLLVLNLQERQLLPAAAAAAARTALAPWHGAPVLLTTAATSTTGSASASHLSQAAVLFGQGRRLCGAPQSVLRLALALFRLPR